VRFHEPRSCAMGCEVSSCISSLALPVMALWRLRFIVYLYFGLWRLMAGTDMFSKFGLNEWSDVTRRKRMWHEIWRHCVRLLTGWHHRVMCHLRLHPLAVLPEVKQVVVIHKRLCSTNLNRVQQVADIALSDVWTTPVWMRLSIVPGRLHKFLSLTCFSFWKAVKLVFLSWSHGWRYGRSISLTATDSDTFVRRCFYDTLSLMSWEILMWSRKCLQYNVVWHTCSA